MIIGIDDTDSPQGMCTTYLTAVLMEKLKTLGTPKGSPHLIRLNPNIQYKTRGNAALALEWTAGPENEQAVMDTTTALVEEMADMGCDNTNPGIVFLDDTHRSDQRFLQELEAFLYMAMRHVLAVDDARTLIDRYDLAHQGFKNGRGLIGALAACGAILCGLSDHTYELIAYRRPENFGTPRDIDHSSVFEADQATYPHTWDTVDVSNDIVVFAPHSPDPVLFGIRGDDTDAIEQAFHLIRSETPGRTVLFITNQGTDMHLLEGDSNELLDDRSYMVTGTVTHKPATIRGGHMFFTLDGTIECAAFEPTKGFRHIVNELVPGDIVRVYGGYKNNTMNIEKLEILDLAEYEIKNNPLCPNCGRRMKSAGSNQGYRCKHCRTTNNEAIRIKLDRKISTGIYEVPPCARRHISKPLIRTQHPKAFPSR